MVKITNLLLLAGFAAAGLPPLLPGADEVADARAQGLRLVKTSDEDPGTWMTEEEKFERLISRRVGFVDITDTLVRHCSGHSLFFFYPISFRAGRFRQRF